nr:uncharacterized protein LOC129255554 [Lytechinus pictus]
MWPRFGPRDPPRRKADSSPGIKHQERKTNVKDNTHKSWYFCGDCYDYHPNTNHDCDSVKREETGKPSVYTKAKTDSKPFKNSGTFNDGTQFTSQHFSKPSKKSDPQPTKPTYKPFGFGIDPLNTGIGVGKNPFGFGVHFPRNSEPSEGAKGTTPTPASTNTKKSDTEKKVPNPQPSTHLPKKGILKNPSNRGSFIYTGIPPRSPRLSSQKPQEKNADIKSDVNASKSDLDPNLSRRSTLYSFSYVGKTEGFDIPMKHADPFSSGARGPNHQKPNRSTHENAKPARSSEQNMKGSGTNADDAKSTGRTATEEQPTQTNTKPQMKETTASKENLTDSNKTPEKETKKKASTTVSSLSREAGNFFFSSARDQRSDLVKSISLKSALGCYKKACNWSYQDEDFVSAAKNAATTCWKLAKLQMASRSVSDLKETGKYFKDALQYFSKAYRKRSCRGQDWAKHLEKSIQSCLDDIKTWIAPKDDDDQITTLKEYLGYLPTCGAKINGYLHIANIHMKRGKEALQFDEYENCQRYLKDCCVPLGEAENMLYDDVYIEPTIRLSVNALKKNVGYHESLVKKALARVKEAQARQQREKADEEAKKMAMDQLKFDIRTLDYFSKLSIEEFVKQVYRKWPPKGTKSPDVSSTSSSSSSKKKLLIRAISQYHPDKVDKEIHGIKWQLLSCEITKCLSMKLAIIK